MGPENAFSLLTFPGGKGCKPHRGSRWRRPGRGKRGLAKPTGWQKPGSGCLFPLPSQRFVLIGFSIVGGGGAGGGGRGGGRGRALTKGVGWQWGRRGQLTAGAEHSAGDLRVSKPGFALWVFGTSNGGRVLIGEQCGSQQKSIFPGPLLGVSLVLRPKLGASGGGEKRGDLAPSLFVFSGTKGGNKRRSVTEKKNRGRILDRAADGAEQRRRKKFGAGTGGAFRIWALAGAFMGTARGGGGQTACGDSAKKHPDACLILRRRRDSLVSCKFGEARAHWPGDWPNWGAPFFVFKARNHPRAGHSVFRPGTTGVEGLQNALLLEVVLFHTPLSEGEGGEGEDARGKKSGREKRGQKKKKRPRLFVQGPGKNQGGPKLIHTRGIRNRTPSGGKLSARFLPPYGGAFFFFLAAGGKAAVKPRF